MKEQKIPSKRIIKLLAFLPINIFLLLFFYNNLTAQDQQFKGVIKSKAYNEDHHIKKNRAAKILQKLNPDLPPSEMDTLYRTYYICEDTLIMYIKGVEGLFQAKEVQIGEDIYIYDYKYQSYLKRPEAARGFSEVKPLSWKVYKKDKHIPAFNYNYTAINPENRSKKYFVKVDRSKRYPLQQKLNGNYAMMFHPLGLVDTSVTLDIEKIPTINFYQYHEDSKQTCNDHLDNFDKIREVDGALKDLLVMKPKSVAFIPEEERQLLTIKRTIDTKGKRKNLSEFLGKYVYVDVWASWCVPCIAEMPYLKEIQEKYEGQNLEILSISFDKGENRTKWLQAIRKQEMNWHNWIIYDGFKSEFSTAQNIKTIPRYLLLDPQGRIMNADSPRPSSEALVKMLDSALKE